MTRTTDRSPPRRLCTLALIALFAALIASFSELSSAAELEANGGGAVLESFPVAKGGDYLIVPLVVGDRTVQCVVDTGATHNFFDLELAPLLGKPLGTENAGTAGPDVKVKYYRAPPIRLGRLEADPKFDVACHDFLSFRDGSGHRFYGVIGMATLWNRVVRIDFDQGKFEILAPATDAENDWGEPIPLIARNGGTQFEVPMKIGGLERRFLLDTGCDQTTLSDSFLKDLAEQPEVRRVLERRSMTHGGSQESPHFVVDEMSLGGQVIKDSVVRRSVENKLGLKTLSRFQIVLDFPNRVMYLKPGASFGVKDQPDMSGLEFGRSARGNTIVAHVHKSEAAARAGFREADKLLQVDGRDAATYSIFELRELLSSEHDRRIPIVYSRSGRKYQTTLVLNDPTKTPPTPAAQPLAAAPTAATPTVVPATRQPAPQAARTWRSGRRR